MQKILLSTRALLSQGICTGTYAKDRSGQPCGLNSINAASWDLPGALWRSCPEVNREGSFATAWSKVREHLQRPKDERSPEFCRWLDNRSANFILSFLDELIAGLPYRANEAKFRDAHSKGKTPNIGEYV